MKRQTTTPPRPGSFKERRADAARQRDQAENARFAQLAGAAQPLSAEMIALHTIVGSAILQSLAGNQCGDFVTVAAISAARAFRAGLAAFTSPAEAVVGGSNDALPVTKHFGGAKVTA